MIDILSALISRELQTLRREVEAYPDESSLWARTDAIGNSGGQLVHHITGNLRHFIGATLGGTGYVRDRGAEFSRSDLSRAELLERIAAAEEEVRRSLENLSAEALTTDYPQAIAGYRVRTGEFLMHLLAHLAYHLGQVDYHRRILADSPTTTDAVATKEIPGARRLE